MAAQKSLNVCAFTDGFILSSKTIKKDSIGFVDVLSYLFVVGYRDPLEDIAKELANSVFLCRPLPS